MVIACIISFIIGAMMMLFAMAMAAMAKEREPRNKVHFYVTRDTDGTLELWFGFPRRTGKYYLSLGPTTQLLGHGDSIRKFGLNPSDYDNITFDSGPVEVFLNLGD